MNRLMRAVRISDRGRRILCGLSVAVFGLLAGGCARVGGGAGQDEPAILKIDVALDGSSYRPEEAMVMTVSLTNDSQEEQPIRNLDAQSVEFWFHLAGSSETPIRRQPVYSLHEQMDQFSTLAPGETVQRKFLLTRMTHFRGNMVAQTHYKRGIPFDAMKTNKIYSNVVEYVVQGEPLFEREDAAGIIVKDAAMALAGAQCQDKVLEAQALLVEDEMGFYCYWVNLKVEDAQGASVLTGYLVDPYRGEVKGEAKPFDPQSAQDPRFKRPGTLPNLGVPTQQTRYAR